mmetsp:Transcript_85659/g.223570  ORF Transcript_85659/g.223570 Transcript_85659/m.223570 type:complete len:220 (+) Transcript_85659:1728-2387(+)
MVEAFRFTFCSEQRTISQAVNTTFRSEAPSRTAEGKVQLLNLAPSQRALRRSASRKSQSVNLAAKSAAFSRKAPRKLTPVNSPFTRLAPSITALSKEPPVAFASERSALLIAVPLKLQPLKSECRSCVSFMDAPSKSAPVTTTTPRILALSNLALHARAPSSFIIPRSASSISAPSKLTPLRSRVPAGRSDASGEGLILPEPFNEIGTYISRSESSLSV